MFARALTFLMARWAWTAVAALFAALTTLLGVAAAPNALPAYTYDAPVNVYDARVLWSSPNTSTAYGRGSPWGPEVASWKEAASTCGCSVAANSGVTRVFRVEGPGNARLGIDGAGNVSIQGDKTLFLNFGDEARAQAVLEKRLAQGYEGTTIKSFEVPNSYVDSLRARAVPESMARGNSVFQVDVGQTSGSFGLRSSEFPGLQCATIPGSGC
jgi:hypothetical protein